MQLHSRHLIVIAEKAQVALYYSSFQGSHGSVKMRQRLQYQESETKAATAQTFQPSSRIFTDCEPWGWLNYIWTLFAYKDMIRKGTATTEPIYTLIQHWTNTNHNWHANMWLDRPSTWCPWESEQLHFTTQPTVQSAALWEKLCGSLTIELTCVGVEKWVLKMRVQQCRLLLADCNFLQCEDRHMGTKTRNRSGNKKRGML